jgi:hypothetical protein
MQRLKGQVSTLWRKPGFERFEIVLILRHSAAAPAFLDWASFASRAPRALRLYKFFKKKIVLMEAVRRLSLGHECVQLSDRFRHDFFPLFFFL